MPDLPKITKSVTTFHCIRQWGRMFDFDYPFFVGNAPDGH
jgi:hypothetical protein